MNKDVVHMMDGKTFMGLVGTASSSLAGYLDILEPVVGISVTLVVGGLTAWYTYERASKLRDERKSRKREEKQ